MTSSPERIAGENAPVEPGSVEMPRPTIAPAVVGLGLALLGLGVATHPAFLILGAGILIAGIGVWVAQLLPGQGHTHDPLAPPEQRPAPVTARPGTVEHLREGMPGYRMRLPLTVHPISAGIKGGIVGGLVMPVPALLWSLVSESSPWYPINLLAGMVLPGVGDMEVDDLKHFHLLLLVVALVIHAAMSVVLGLLYGVLLPTLPDIPKAVSWGGLLMPLLWTGASFSTMWVVNPALAKGVAWPWFIASQFVFGIVSAAVFLSVTRLKPVLAGLLGGLVGGLAMPVPALLWSLANHRGLWYPVNLLAGMVVPGMDELPPADLQAFNATWLLIAIAIHATLSLVFGLAYPLVLPRVPPIPGPLAWGGLLLPLLWTAVSFSLMGVVNPVLQKLVDWPWFIVSQFVFGVAAAIVVDRSEKIHIPPAGRPSPGQGQRGAP